MPFAAVLDHCWPEGRNAAVRRQTEFVAARYCAWQSLNHTDAQLTATAAVSQPGYSSDALDVPHHWVERATAGEPLWPADRIGSISHCAGKAIAVTASAQQLASVGIDIDRGMPYERAMAVLPVLTSAIERERLKQWVAEGVLSDAIGHMGTRDEDTMRCLVTLVFSAKESLYKALYPLVGVYFDYRDADVVAIGGHSCTMELKRTLSAEFPAGKQFELGWQCGWPDATMMVSWLLLPQERIV
nr:4'-phosphopantetheinyl transferase superfamily protein [Oceanobacter mangrovi]